MTSALISASLIVAGARPGCCKAGDFLRTLRETVLPEHRAAPVDLLVIETSGMADPEAIGHLMRDHGLDRDFALQHIVSVIAPTTLARLLGKLPVVEAQLRTSDLIVINKTDTVSGEALDEVEAAVRQLNPDAEIVRAAYCRFPFPFGSTTAPVLRDGALSTCEANPFSTALGVWPSHRSLPEARTWLEALPPSILRVKGRIATPQGAYHVERTLDSLSLHPAAPGEAVVVLIAHDDDEADLIAAMQTLLPAPETQSAKPSPSNLAPR